MEQGKDGYHKSREVGLDAGHRFFHTLKEQKRIFQHILQCCAEVGGKILSVHSIRSANIVLNLLEEVLQTKNNKVVLHWFTGNKKEADQAVKFGCYFSINAEMLQTAKGNALLRRLPNERLLTETDGPFTQYRNRPNQPKDVALVVKLLAELQNTTPEIISNMIASNLRILLEDNK